MGRGRGIAAVVMSVLVVGACSSGSHPSAPSSVATASTTTLDPLAQPDTVFRESATTGSVAVGATFQVRLPQDPHAGSWDYSQRDGPVRLLSGGSEVNPDNSQDQTFNFQAVSPGTEQLAFTYSGGMPPGPSAVTFTLTAH